MLFNSFDFILFFIVVYGIYRCLRHTAQNRWLLAASYFFYGCWDWRFLGLILISTATDFICARRINQSDLLRHRKLWLSLSCAVNLGILGFFKYFDFFSDSLTQFGSVVGLSFSTPVLNLVLPVGISFYTFQSLSYSIDVYRRQVAPVQSFFDYALYVSFFPQLVAGPIERASRFVPQVLSKRVISRAQIEEGSWLFMRGLFKKVFIADNLARHVDLVFNAHGTVSGGEVLMALYAFAFQVYGDFSGYSDMARGLAKWMGFELCLNFKFPYFVTNPRDFWRHWHISLSTWLRDYLYIPLGGNRGGLFRISLNLMITMILGGLWHGASFHFVLWGAYHGLLLTVCRLWEARSKHTAPQKKGSLSPVLYAIKIISMFQLTCLGWLLFRAGSAEQILLFLRQLFFNFSWPPAATALAMTLIQSLWLLGLLESLQWLKQDVLFELKWPAWCRIFLYMSVFYFIVLLGGYGQEFIYFQF